MKTNMCSAGRQCQLIQSIYCTNEETQEDLQALRKPNIVTEVPSWCSWVNHWSHLRYLHHCLRKQQYFGQGGSFPQGGSSWFSEQMTVLRFMKKNKGGIKLVKINLWVRIS